MCDYSLELYRSRPATQEEQYTLRRFPSGTMGFTAARDCETAVCIPADARLRLEGIGEAVQQAFGVGSTEEVVMTRLEGGAYAHKDAVRFDNGKEVLLQSFNAGVTAELVVPASDRLTDREEMLLVRAPADLVDA